jgi:hypothetical protein
VGASWYARGGPFIEHELFHLNLGATTLEEMNGVANLPLELTEIMA